MLGRVGLVSIAVVSVLIALQQQLKPKPEPREYVRGRNNTVLYLVIEHPGLSNVHAATAQSLLQHHPEVGVHFASFPKLSETLSRISSFAQTHQPKAKNITFHSLTGPSYYDAIGAYPHINPDEDGKLGSIGSPGMPGLKKIMADIQIYLDPWKQEEHLEIYRQLINIIDEVDPAVVALDTVFSPAIEATRAKNRVHAFITPNMLIDNFPGEQPWAGMLWKYPAMGSGFPFPVPLKLVLQNIWLNFCFISSLIKMPDLSAKREFLKANGVPNPINFYGLHRPDVPWITQTTHAATVPVDFIPENVTCTGPITLSAAPAEEQDADLMEWVKQKPTVLINMGSAYTWSRTQTRIMIEALQQVLSDTDLQVLWKYKRSDNLVDFDWKSLVSPLEATGRVKATQWLSIDPFSLMETGHISAFVTHGGANGFHESIAAGVPQIVLPMWVDLFNYAQLAEQIGVGVWGCRETSPEWTPECLRDDIVKVAAGPDSKAFRTKAKEISVEASKDGPGRDISAATILKLARSGY